VLRYTYIFCLVELQLHLFAVVSLVYLNLQAEENVCRTVLCSILVFSFISFIVRIICRSINVSLNILCDLTVMPLS